MIDAQVVRATCQVTCGSEVGTGWLVTSTQVITARHCVTEAIAKGAPIIVHFELDGAAEEIIAIVVAEEEAIDTCVIKLAREMDVAPVLLSESVAAEGSRFSAFGFPVTKLSIGHRLEGSISRVLGSPKLIMDLDLQIDAPSALSSYEGISGAALMCDDRCRGMLRIAVDKSIGALSIASMSAFLRRHSIPTDSPHDERASAPLLAPRVEFTKMLDSLISAMAGGYAFIEGAPGIGKSTFCETYQPSMPTLEHFGTYSFTPQSSGTNAMHLAQPEVFFDWLNTLISLHLTGKAARVSEKRYPELIVATERHLDRLASSYSSQGKVGVIFVDGLDEVAKLGQHTLERFVGLLPSRIPTGLAVVVSGSNYVNLSGALGARIESRACLTMPALAREASRVFCASVLLPERTNATTIQIICDKAQGHALYLRYLIDLANGGADDAHLSASPLIDGSIRNYYEALWPKLLADPEAVNFLAIIARLRWGIPTEQLTEILNDAERASLVTTLARIQHLLLRPHDTTIYHSSFSDFLIEKTALRELDVQRRLSNFCTTHPNDRYGTLNTVYHGLKSGGTTRTVATCNQDWVDRCVTMGAQPDALLGDVDDALAEAAQQGSLVEVIRLLLLAQRIQFRYDTIFAQSADLTADALIALGKTHEALQHAVRYGHLIVPARQALRLAFRLIAAGESEAAFGILDKADIAIERQINQKLSIRGFIALFELRVQVLLLKRCGGDDAEPHALMNFYAQSIEAARDSIADDKVLRACLFAMAGFFGGSMACLAGRYVPISVLRKYHSGSTAALAHLLLRLLTNYQALCSHFRVTPERSLLDLAFADLRLLLDELGHEWDKPNHDIIDAVVSLGASFSLVHDLVNSPLGKLTSVRFVAADNVSLDADRFTEDMAQWRLASMLDKDLPCPASAEIRASEWRGGIDLICRALAWCDGAARRASECGDASELGSVWSLLEQHVFEPLRFTLAQRAQWNVDSYAVPEAVFPEVYGCLTNLVADVFPERLGRLLSFVDERFPVQCGLYSEGFRSILAKVLERVAGLPLEAGVESEAFALLQRWRNFVQSNVKNRHELVPELLTIIPLFVRLSASEEAHRTYRAVLAFSMGPSWYKEDQLSLMVGALEQVPKGEPLEAGLLSRVAGNLEAASGEMTFQRFVRYDKAALIDALCQREDYSNAVRYFLRQSCGTAEELFREASEGEIDRTSPLTGMRFPGGALDEQDALYRMLTKAIPSAHWPLCWTLLEIYQFGDTRHLQKSAKAYAHLAERARHESGAHAVMIERLKLICESEFDDGQREEFLSEFRNYLPPDLLESFQAIFRDAPSFPEIIETDEVHRAPPDAGMSEADSGEQHGASRDMLFMPGTFGTQASTHESDEALRRAEKQLARGNASSARTEALAALEHLQRGGWSIWNVPSASAKRAEEILRHDLGSSDPVVKLYAPLILSERYADKWRRANHLIEQIAPIATSHERTTLVRLVVEHAETMIGDAAAYVRDYQFLDEARTLDVSSSLLQLILAAPDHPQWLRRDKAAELLLWLLWNFPQYVPIMGPRAFAMDSGNLPDVLCGVLDHLSSADATNLWDQLAPVLDFDAIQRTCKHLGRFAVFLRIADRAVRKGSASAVTVLERTRPSMGQSAAVAASPLARCPIWASVADAEWRELTAMGLATEALAERATTVIQEACAPLSIGTMIELEGLLATGFRDNADHSLGRWKAKVRHALQVALMPYASEALLPRIDRLFRPYNPARILPLRIVGFASPTLAWLAALSGSGTGFEPAQGDDVYLDFFERVWDGRQFRSLRLTAFFYGWNNPAIPPVPPSGFPSTDLPTSSAASTAETCARVKWRPAFFGSFTPAVPSHTLMDMTRAPSADFTRAHWRIGRTPTTDGAGPIHEGCFLAIKRAALRLPGGVRLAWMCEIDQRQSGILGRAT